MYLGDTLDDPMPSIRTGLGNLLGVSLDSATLRDMIAELLIQHGDDTGRSRWKPLQPAGNQYEIYLGDKIYEQPVISGGVGYTESFNKADSATLGPDLTWTEVSGTVLDVVSNQCKNTGTEQDGHARAEHDTSTSDQFGQLTVITMEGITHTSTGGVAVRYASAAQTFYLWQAQFVPGSANEHAWSKWVTGTETYPIGTISTEDFANGEVLRCLVQGSTLRGYKDGVLLKEITDTSISGNTRGGIRAYHGSAGAAGVWIGDNFSFGDITTQGVSAFLLVGVGT
jgi:hypothetical protein